MASFRADVDWLSSDGSLAVTVDGGSCKPAGLVVETAAVIAFSGSGSAHGVYEVPDAVTFFPSSALGRVTSAKRIEISWTPLGTDMTKLKIKKVG
jgi:hypothetical protein